ncbi:MAG: hypothetical protein ChlgKO_10680 [Chlamydiales bacterium]
MTTKANYTNTNRLSYPNVFHALYEAVEGNKEKLDLKVIQQLFQSSIKDDGSVTINQLNEVKLGLVFTLDSDSDFLLDASEYEKEYGPTTASSTLEDYKKENYIDSDNSCKFSDLFTEKQNKPKPFVEKATVYGAVAVAALAILCFSYLRAQ